MGRSEYSNPLTPLVDDVRDSVLEIELLLDELKNTDVAELATNVANIRTGNKLYKKAEFNVSPPVSNQYYDVLDITGKGFLTRIDLLIVGGTTASANVTLQVVIDGIPTDYSYAGNNDANKMSADASGMRYLASSTIYPSYFMNVQFDASLIVRVKRVDSSQLAVHVDWGLV